MRSLIPSSICLIYFSSLLLFREIQSFLLLLLLLLLLRYLRRSEDRSMGNDTSVPITDTNIRHPSIIFLFIQLTAWNSLWLETTTVSRSEKVKQCRRRRQSRPFFWSSSRSFSSIRFRVRREWTDANDRICRFLPLVSSQANCLCLHSARWTRDCCSPTGGYFIYRKCYNTFAMSFIECCQYASKRGVCVAWEHLKIWRRSPVPSATQFSSLNKNKRTAWPSIIFSSERFFLLVRRATKINVIIICLK